MIDAQTRVGIHFDDPWLHIFVNQHVKAKNFERFAPKLEFIREANYLILKKRTEDLHHFATGLLDCTFKIFSTRLILLTDRVP